MNTAFRNFMKGLVDYAGLFPPARLDMASAVAAYAAHRDDPAAWMLGRFIVPVGRLDEMVAALPREYAAVAPWELSVLVGGGADPADTLKSLPTQLVAIARTETDGGGGLVAPALEMPLPVMAPDGLRGFLQDLKAVLRAARAERRQLFLEVPAAGSGQDDQEYLAAIKEAGPSPSGQDGALIGAKFRCGGLTPEAFPSVERLAGIIAGCAGLDLPLKFTAGLHHPVRHQAREPEVMMHGFLNVFGAGMLAAAGQGDANQGESGLIEACVAETDPAAFRFDAGSFRWRDHHVPAAEVARLRSRLLAGFGSCSFDEPCDDLNALGLPVAGEGN